MENECLFNEKQSIRESGRSLKKYGSTCNHVRNSNDCFIRHDLAKEDTLQGIALKYGCTMEQIRRTNRLFAQDSMFLREYLMIPIEKNSPYYPKDDRPHSLPPRAASIAVCSSQDATKSTNNNFKSVDSVVLTPEEENKRNISEFLGKIDLNIAETRKYVAKSQNNFDFIPNEYDDVDSGNNNYSSRRRIHTSASSSSSSFQQYHSRNNSAGSNNNNSNNNNNNHNTNNESIQLLSITQGRHVQNSLQRLEKQQDEFFEL